MNPNTALVCLAAMMIVLIVGLLVGPPMMNPVACETPRQQVEG